VSPLRWGILGAARIAPRIVRGVGDSGRSTLTAVASRDAARGAAFAARHDIPLTFGSYQGLLDSPDVDVVYIALPNHLHAPWAVRALDAGKHVLCEKPLALTVDEVDAIIAAAQRNGRLAAEAFMYLHHPQTLRAVELARSGELGELQLVLGTFSFLIDHPNDPRLEPDMGGGSLWDVGCYPVSLARRVAAEEPDRVQAFARFDERGVDRTFIGQLRFPGGLLAQFDSGFAARDRERVEIVGSEANLVLTAPFLVEPDGPPASLTLRHGRAETVIPVEGADQVAAEVRDLEAAVLDGRELRVSLAFSRGTVATLVALDRAARGVPDGVG
jgi:xylose dehydrogenase (NAD/NADP)